MVTDTDPGNPVNADMWRAIGRLEGATAALLEGQREIRADLLEGQREIKASLLEVQRETRAGLESANQRIDRLSHRIDRLFYAILAVSGALLAAVLASRFIGG
jgi:hypothetical protein